MKFKQWLDKQLEEDGIEIKMISVDDQLDKLYWHRILRYEGNKSIPDGDYYVTACFKENDEYIFGLLPLNKKKIEIKTIKCPSLIFLNNSEIIDREEYGDKLDKIDAAIEKLNGES